MHPIGKSVREKRILGHTQMKKNRTGRKDADAAVTTESWHPCNGRAINKNRSPGVGIVAG